MLLDALADAACFYADFGECSAAVIAEEQVGVVTRLSDVEVEIAVTVVVEDCHAGEVVCDCCVIAERLLRDVREWHYVVRADTNEARLSESARAYGIIAGSGRTDRAASDG